MKKTYEKPRLVALSLSGNDLLCAACPIDAEGPNMDSTLSQILNDFGVDIFTALGSGEECQFEITGYCKFSSADSGNILFNS